MPGMVTTMGEFDRQIRARAYEYLTGAAPFEAFEQWVVENAWDEAPGSLGAQVDALLAERQAVSDESFAQQLRVIVSTVRLSGQALASSATSGSLLYEHTANLVTHGNQTVTVHLELAGT